MKTHSPASSREEDLEEALRGLCNLLTKLQQRAAEYLPEGDSDDFINEILGLLDGSEQRRVQRAARLLLNETHGQSTLRRQ
jgi:hypothetical protein